MFFKYIKKIGMMLCLVGVYFISVLLICISAGEEPFIDFRKSDVFLLLVLASYCQSFLLYCLTKIVRSVVLNRKNYLSVVLNSMHSLFIMLVIYFLAYGQYWYIDDLFKYR